MHIADATRRQLAAVAAALAQQFAIEPAHSDRLQFLQLQRADVRGDIPLGFFLVAAGGLGRNVTLNPIALPAREEFADRDLVNVDEVPLSALAVSLVISAIASRLVPLKLRYCVLPATLNFNSQEALPLRRMCPDMGISPQAHANKGGHEFSCEP